MSVYSGDFLGFQIGNIHSSQLNITRVSNNGRYSDTLLPNFTDTTAAVPGGDGTYYWDTFYNQKVINIDFAFDDLGENELRRLRQVLGFKGVQELIFDEAVYKKYMVKCSGPPTLKYVAFEDNNITIYKGEGSVNFVALYPYAISTHETELINSSTTGEMNLDISNAGDIEMPIKVIYTFNRPNVTLTLKKDSEVINTLVISNLQQISGPSVSVQDSFYCVDMRTHLVEGLNSSFKKTGHLYNQYISSGDFFNVPVGVYTLNSSADWKRVQYSYLYY